MAECNCSSQQREGYPCKDKEKEGSGDAKSRLGKVGFIRRLTMRPWQPAANRLMAQP